MSVVADGGESSDELVVRYTQVVLEFPCGQVPDEQREWLLGLIATDTNFTIGRGEKTVEESVFARFKGRLQVLWREWIKVEREEREARQKSATYPSAEVDHIDVHSISREGDNVPVAVQSIVGHLLIHDALQLCEQGRLVEVVEHEFAVTEHHRL